jgi:hypothetical protein
MDNNKSQEHSNKIIDVCWPVIHNNAFDGIHQIRHCPLTEDGNKAGLRNVVYVDRVSKKSEERRALQKFTFFKCE